MSITNGYQIAVIVLLLLELVLAAAYYGKPREKNSPTIIRVGLWVFLLVMGGFFK